MKPKVIRDVRDGVEFYTCVYTGESGMSVSGLARLCATPQSTVDDVLSDLVTGNPRSECLEPFAGQVLWLPERGINNAKIVKDEICAAVIEHYAYEANKKTNDRKLFGRFAIVILLLYGGSWRNA